MESYTSSSGGPLGPGLGALHSSHSSASSQGGAPVGGPTERGPTGGPLSYGVPSYPSGGPPRGPPLHLYNGDAAEASGDSSLGLKEAPGRQSDLSNFISRGTGGPPGLGGPPAGGGGPGFGGPSSLGGPLFGSSSKYAPGGYLGFYLLDLNGFFCRPRGQEVVKWNKYTINKRN